MPEKKLVPAPLRAMLVLRSAGRKYIRWLAKLVSHISEDSYWSVNNVDDSIDVGETILH